MHIVHSSHISSPLAAANVSTVTPKTEALSATNATTLSPDSENSTKNQSNSHKETNTSLGNENKQQATTSDRQSSKTTEEQTTQAEQKAQAAAEKQQQLQELKEIQALGNRDREVRAHEQAHASVGGQYAGAPSYTYERGPDGKNYAIGGEVNIDVSAITGDPAATIQKMQIVRRAALAPAEPSGQDRQVAAQAAATEAQARAELAKHQAEQRSLPTDHSEEQSNADDDQQDNVSGSFFSNHDKKASNHTFGNTDSAENQSNSLKNQKALSAFHVAANPNRANDQFFSVKA